MSVKVLASVLTMPVLLVTLIGNGLVVAAIVKSKKLRERPGTYIVASLSLVDGIFMPISMGYDFLEKLSVGNEFCVYFATYFVILVYVSILHLLLLSVDRYIAVVFPLHYKSILTPRRCLYLLIVAWFLPIFSMIVVPFIYGEGNSSLFRGGLIGCSSTSEAQTPAHLKHLVINTILMFIVPFVTMLILNGKIAIISYKQAKKTIPVLHLTYTERRNKEKRMQEMKWAKTIGRILLIQRWC